MANPYGVADSAPRFPRVDLDTIRPHRGWFVGLGVVLAVIGVLAIVLPLIASLATTVVLGWLMLIAGVFQVYHAVQNRGWAHSGWAVASGVISFAAGAVLVLFPVAGTLALTLVLAAFFLASGVFKLIRAAQHKPLAAWGWLLFDGLLSLALGVILLLGWPGTAVWALGLLVGIDLVFGGASLVLIGLAARPAVTVGR